jgi:hypothetical protein
MTKPLEPSTPRGTLTQSSQDSPRPVEVSSFFDTTESKKRGFSLSSRMENFLKKTKQNTGILIPPGPTVKQGYLIKKVSDRISNDDVIITYFF